MAKMRGIKPETWTDDKFVTLTPLARLLFIGMWNYTCDNGHLDDSPMQLKMRVLPADDANITELLDELVTSGLVARGNGWIKVSNLTSHQRIDPRFIVFCDHCEDDPQATYSRDDKKPRKTPARSAHDVHPASARATATSARVEGRKEGEGEGRKAPSSPHSERTTCTDPTGPGSSATAEGECDDPSPSFEDFWELYPRKVSKGRARAAWARATKSATPAEILHGLTTTLPALRDVDERYRPHPATWLDDERWGDDPADELDPWAYLDGPEDAA